MTGVKPFYLVAYAYEFERSQDRQTDDATINWQERVLVVCSQNHAQQQANQRFGTTFTNRPEKNQRTHTPRRSRQVLDNG